MELFNKIGKTYNETRQADKRIVDMIIKLLGLQTGTTIADIGAGTGNYSIALANYNFKIKAIEPSYRMSSNTKQHPNIEWFKGYAENIPLLNSSVDGVISTLALHHFSNSEKSIKEMVRISNNGPIVIFTFDAKAGRTTWLYNYFPFFWDNFKHLPAIEEIVKIMTKITGKKIQIVPFKLPSDLKDNFAAAAWRQPHQYLDKTFRSNISSFRITQSDIVNNSVACLSADLDSGRWKELYGNIIDLKEMEAGYRFLCTNPD